MADVKKPTVEDKKPQTEAEKNKAKDDKKKRDAHWAQFVNWYQSNYGNGSTPPAALKKQYMEGYLVGKSWGNDRAAQWIRLNDKNYEKTDVYRSQMLAIQGLYKSAGLKVDKAKLKAMEAYARSRPVGPDVQKAFLAKWFAKNVMTTEAFKVANPGFDAWRKNPANRNAGDGDIMVALDDYVALQNRFRTGWAAKGLPGAIPDDILNKAMEENWVPEDGDARWMSAMLNSSAYASTQSYADRVTEFRGSWSSVMPDGVEPSAAMVEKFARGDKSWNDFLATSVKDSPEFKAAYPDYDRWESAQHKKGGEANAEGQVDIMDYFEAKTSYQDEWESLYENGEPVDATVLAQAMAGNWSLTKFRNTIKKLPLFKTTTTGKKKQAEFGKYMRGLFGDAAPIDAALEDKYMSGEFDDPSVMWDDIKQTSQFRSQFQNWDSFAAAQAASGVNVTEDPMMYKEYQTEFYKAFSDIGMAVPAGMDREIFASGLNTTDIANNAEAYQKTKESYDWQTGQQADIRPAIGLGNKVAGGDLRLRMKAAIEQHRTYAASKFNQFEVDKTNGMMVKKI